MKVSSQIRELAKRLVSLSLDDDGKVEESRVQEILDALRGNPPREHKQLLDAYLEHIKPEIAKSIAIIEYAGRPDDENLNAIKERLSQNYGRVVEIELRENRELLAGIRITVGDDVYEDSAATRLRPLVRAFG